MTEPIKTTKLLNFLKPRLEITKTDQGFEIICYDPDETLQKVQVDVVKEKELKSVCAFIGGFFKDRP